MKAKYAALNLRDPHDWQPKKGVKLQRAAVKKVRKTETPMTKAQRKAEKKAMEQKKQKRNKHTEFVLHMPDGEAYDARKPIIVADDPDKEEGEDEDMTAEDAAAIELAKFMKNGSSYRPFSGSQSPDWVPENVAAWRKHRVEDASPFAALKKPKLDDDEGSRGASGEA